MPINRRFSMVATEEEINWIALKAEAEGFPSATAWARQRLGLDAPRPQGRTKKIPAKGFVRIGAGHDPTERFDPMDK